jgi:UDP-N-acetylmuramoylalanine--D-glutamate ligase
LDHHGDFSVNWVSYSEAQIKVSIESLLKMGFALKKDSDSPKQAIDNDKLTIVIGLGETGMSVAEYLSKKNIPFTMLDTRANPPKLAAFKQRFPNNEIYLGEFEESRFSQASQIIVSPGVDIKHHVLRKVVKAYDCECIGDIELFARSSTRPVVAVTGSNGKSTVTSLIAEMARCANVRAYAGGNLGPPALELLEHEDAELFVLELSSFQLESTQSLQPHVSVVLNISPDHLDRHGDVERYAHIKEHIYSNANNSVINREDVYVSNMKTSGNRISFGLDKPMEGHFGVINEDGCAFLAFGEKHLLPVNELALKGESGILNSLAGLALGHTLNLPMQKMLEVLKSFIGLPHRLVLVTEHKGVAWFNDSKGTNIGATISSLRSLNNNIILIAGGIFKGGDLGLLKQAVIRHAKQVVLLGKDAELLQQGLASSVPIEHASSMHDAVMMAQKIATKGDQVLLSPACASFDMYQNYMERGSDFENCVKELLS